jgi:hypothetical protein
MERKKNKRTTTKFLKENMTMKSGSLKHTYTKRKNNFAPPKFKICAH